MRGDGWNLTPIAAAQRYGLHSCFLVPFAIFPLLGCASDRANVSATGPAHTTVSSSPAANSTPVTRLQKPEPEPSETKRQTPAETPKESTDIWNRTAENGQTVRVMAEVNGVAILEDEVRDGSLPLLMQLQEPERSARRQEVTEIVLQELIDRELLLHDVNAKLKKNNPKYLEKLKEEARKQFDKHLRTIKSNFIKAGAEIKNEDDLKKLLLTQGITLDAYRRSYERKFMSTEYLRARVFPQIQGAIGRQQIVEYYEAHASEFEAFDSVNWQDVFIDASRFKNREEAGCFAAKIAAEAREGADFIKLVKQYDQGDSSYRDGEGVGHRHGEIRPAELEPMLFEMKEGDIGPVFEVRNGFHVIRLAKREHAGRKPLDAKIQAEIRTKLLNEMAFREQKRVMAELRRKASIRLADEQTSAALSSKDPK